ncbi:bicyclomycin/multidrug efflux system [compost metagenome]
MLGLYETTALLFIFLCCLGFVSPNASALSLLPFSKNAGTASALMGAIQMGIGALASVGVSLFNVKSAVPTVSIMALSSILAIGILYFGKQKIVRLPV